jgi:hypothetical protein
MKYAKNREWRSFCREMYQRNSKERRIWKEKPYPTLYSYVKNNYRFLEGEFKKQNNPKREIKLIEVKQLSLI